MVECGDRNKHRRLSAGRLPMRMFAIARRDNQNTPLESTLMIKMTKTAQRIAALAVAAVAINGGVVQPSPAQVTALPQPEFRLKDVNDVDLLSFNVYLQLTDASIGSKEHPLTHTILSGVDGTWVGNVNASGGGTVAVNAAVDSLGVNSFWGSGVWASGAYPAACPAATSGTPYVTVRFAEA